MSGSGPGGPGGLDALAAVAAVHRGEVLPETLLADAHSRAQRWEPWLGAIVEFLDRPGSTGGPLAGTIAGVKELIAVAGARRDCGAGPFLDHPAPADTDATAVTLLTANGAGLFATLSSHALAYGVTTPQTRNPRTPDRVAGGSSGGAAAAVAAGIVHLALGTDTGGSVRIPAACCGVVGLKTTRGVVPLTGIADLAWSLDTVGPLAATVADAALLFDAVVGYDPLDPASREAPLLPGLDGPPRIGVPRQLEEMAIDPDVRTVLHDTLGDLVSAGATIVAVDLSGLVEASKENGLVIAAEAAAVHGWRVHDYGHLLPDDTRARLSRGTELYASRVARARRSGMLLRAELRRLFGQVDLLCTPTLPCVVPLAGRDQLLVEGAGEPVVSALTRLTGAWNLAGIPAGSVPAGRDGDGAPVAIQLAGPWRGERRVLAGMALVERCRGRLATVPAPER